MKKRWTRICGVKGFFAAVCLAAFFFFGKEVSAGVPDFEETVKLCEEQKIQPEYKEVKNGKGREVRMVLWEDTAYVSVKKAPIRRGPGGSFRQIEGVYLGSKLLRTGICENGWSQVTYEEKGEKPVKGYVVTNYLGDEPQIVKFSDTAEVVQDTDILDYPARKEGEIVGELETDQKVTCTGMINSVWGRILYKDEKGEEQVGYVASAALKIPGMVMPAADSSPEKIDAGIIHKSEGEGIFADAVEGVTLEGTQEGIPVSASATAELKPLGTFRITHYCSCSICCGPWSNGITATGVAAVTNRTIAVDPSQIPYGSKVVINGQVYVAEDCGGAIKENCIDIYVASHEEGEKRGVYYTDVYLLLE